MTDLTERVSETMVFLMRRGWSFRFRLAMVSPPVFVCVGLLGRKANVTGRGPTPNKAASDCFARLLEAKV